MEPIGLKLRLAYYKAPDGPRLVIFGPLDADFSSLQKLFVQLSETPAMSCDLEEQPFVVALGGTRVRLFSTGGMFAQTRGSVQGLRRAGGEAHPNFGWSRTAEGWDYFAQLVGSLVSATKAGHQYLTSYPSEDAIVVLSKGEYGDEVLD